MGTIHFLYDDVTASETDVPVAHSISGAATVISVKPWDCTFTDIIDATEMGEEISL